MLTSSVWSLRIQKTAEGVLRKRTTPSCLAYDVHMHNEDRALYKMQPCRKEDVEKSSKDKHGDHKKSTVPTLEGICISVIEHQESLDDGARLEGNRCLKGS